MTKKRSFFERLTGNLKLDDLDEDIVEEKEIHLEVPDTGRRISVYQEDDADEAHEEEEIGELAIDMHETPKEVIVQAFIAGVPHEHLTINITRDTLTISGKREEHRITNKDSVHIRELYWGSFERTVDLPAEVDVDQSEALEKHGMLIVRLPKIDKGRKTTLKVKPL